MLFHAFLPGTFQSILQCLYSVCHYCKLQDVWIPTFISEGSKCPIHLPSANSSGLSIVMCIKSNISCMLRTLWSFRVASLLWNRQVYYYMQDTGAIQVMWCVIFCSVAYQDLEYAGYPNQRANLVRIRLERLVCWTRSSLPLSELEPFSHQSICYNSISFIYKDLYAAFSTMKGTQGSLQ